MEYQFESELMARESWRRKARPWILVAVAVLAAATVARWRSANGIRIGGSDAWKNISGTEEVDPFRLENGKGYLYPAHDDVAPFCPIVSRSDWVTRVGDRTYALYDVAPGDMEPNGFPNQYHESLWNALLDDDGRIIRKMKLATGVKDISSVRRAGLRGAYVSATTANGLATNIMLRFPDPWPKLESTGDVVKDFDLREERWLDKMWEDYPDNGSGYASERVSVRHEAWLFEECRSAVEALRREAPNEERREELGRELANARNLAYDIAGYSGDTASNVHWGNTMDSLARTQTMEVYVHNWLEAAGNIDGWEAVRHARGALHGTEFAATSGVAVINVPAEWAGRRWDDETRLLLRLSPAHVSRRAGKVFADYDLVDPTVPNSGYMVERGTIAIQVAEQ